MLTLGLLNKNNGCQCCSVRCSSMLHSAMHINSDTKFQLGFSKFQFSTVRTVKRVELHHCAKFCRNHFNRGQDIAIFRYFEMASWRLQPSWIFKIGNFQRSERSRGSNCLTMTNFVEIAPTAAEIWRFCDFSRWRTPPCWIFKILNL